MEIKHAEFLVSNTDYTKCPTPVIPEYAFIGRSNVGKSSLINMLCNRKGLAKTSATPGKTQLINHFKINDSWYLVDLPGYGYAKLSRDKRNEIDIMIKNYIRKRENLVNVFLLVDSRIPPQEKDLKFADWLGENSIPFSLVFTKTDALTKNKQKVNKENFEAALLKSWESIPPIILTSVTNKIGREEILDCILKYNLEFKS
jgi:GTP-binding protein